MTRTRRYLRTLIPALVLERCPVRDPVLVLARLHAVVGALKEHLELCGAHELAIDLRLGILHTVSEVLDEHEQSLVSLLRSELRQDRYHGSAKGKTPTAIADSIAPTTPLVAMSAASVF